MNLDNLKVGMVIKNYKELCRILEVEPTTGGNAKKKQMRWFEEYFRYHKDGFKFIIDEIYDKEVEPMKDYRGLNPNSHNNQKGAYRKYIRLLILNMLSENENTNNKNVLLVGKNRMLLELNMINENYKYANYNREQMANYLGMDLKFVHEFFNTNTKKLKQAVETTLNSLMKNERLIHWTTVKMIGTTNYEHRTATNDELKFILDCESESLEEMGTNNIKHIYAANRVKEFYEKVNNKLNQQDISYAYDAYKIVFSDMVYERNEQLKYKLEIDDIIENKGELNNTICNKLNQSAKNRHYKTKKEAQARFADGYDKEWLKRNNGYKSIVLDDNFIHYNKQLISICIDDDYDDICEKMSRIWQERITRETELLQMLGY